MRHNAVRRSQVAPLRLTETVTFPLKTRNCKMFRGCSSLTLFALPALALSSTWVDDYNVSFHSPANATAAEPASWAGMPIGDGDTVSLTSVDSNGQISFLIGKSDAYDEFHELIKVTLHLCGLI